MSDQETQEVEGAWGVDHRSGGFITDYEGTVLDSYFATDPKYNEGNTLQLCWQTSVDNLDAIAEERDLDEESVETIREHGITQKYSCGPKWVTEDGGSTAEHPRGPRLFHATSQVGRIIDSALGSLEHYGDSAKTPEGGEVKVKLDGLLDVLKARGPANQADIWKGIKLRFEEVVFDYGTDRKGQVMKSTRAMPVEFIGVEGEEAEKPAKATKATKATKAAAATAEQTKAEKLAAAKAKAAAKSAPTNGLGAKLTELGASEDQAKGLIEALDLADDASTFAGLAIDVDGVADNDDLMDAIVDEGPEGLFALKGA
jgi:hypothetical protein